MTTAAPTPAHAFWHHTPDRPLRWLEPLWEPTYDRCDRRDQTRIRAMKRVSYTWGGEAIDLGGPRAPTCLAL